MITRLTGRGMTLAQAALALAAAGRAAKEAAASLVAPPPKPIPVRAARITRRPDGAKG